MSGDHLKTDFNAAAMNLTENLYSVFEKCLPTNYTSLVSISNSIVLERESEFVYFYVGFGR